MYSIDKMFIRDSTKKATCNDIACGSVIIYKVMTVVCNMCVMNNNIEPILWFKWSERDGNIRDW